MPNNKKISKAEPRKVGRPTKYNPQLAAEIIIRVSEGESIRTIIKDKGMPMMSTIFLWLSKWPEFSEQYVRAKQLAADAMAEDIISISDEVYESRDAVAKAKLRVETREWIMARLMPKKYGEMQNINATTEITHRYEDLTDEQLLEAVRERQKRAGKLLEAN